MFCPRCRTENGDAAIRCAGCGAPIAIGEERTGPVDAPLDLDRRARSREDPPGWESLRPVPMDWEMAPPAEATPAALRAGVRAPVRRSAASRPAGEAAPAFPSFPLEPTVAAEAARDAAGPVSGAAAVDATAADPGFDLVVDEEPAPEARAEPEAAPRRVRAPPWRRIASWVVDGALVGLASAALLLPVLAPVLGPTGLDAMSGIAGPSVSLVALLAFAYLWLGTALMGATPGLRTAGLRIVGPDGRRPSPGHAAVRSALALLAAVPLGAGILLALFTRGGQGAHDLGAGTQVVLALPGGRGR